MDALPGTVSNSSNSQVTCPDAYKEVYCVVDTHAFLKAINVADVATLCKERLRLGFLHLKTLKDQGLLVPPKKQESCEKINDSEMIQECSDWEQACVLPTQTRKVKRCINSPSETTGASCIDISSTITTELTPETASRTSDRRMGREKRNIGHDWDSVESDGYDKKQTIPSPTKQKRTSPRKDNAGSDIQNIGRQYQNLPKRSGRNRPKAAAYKTHHRHSRSYCPLKRNTHCQVLGTKTSTKKPIVLINKLSKDCLLSSPLLCSEACKSHDTGSSERNPLDICAELSCFTSTTDAFTKKIQKMCKYEIVSSKQVTPSSESDATAAITTFPVKSKTSGITVSQEVQSNDVSTNVEKLPLAQTIGGANISDNKLSSARMAGKSRKNTHCLKDNGYVSASDEQHSFDNTSTVGRKEITVGKKRDRKTVSKKTRRFLILSDEESVDEMVTQKRSTECTTQKAGLVSEMGKPVSFNVEKKLVECLPIAPAKSLVCGLVVDDSTCDPVADINRDTENQNHCDQVLSNADKDSHNVTTPQELKQSMLSSKVAQLYELKSAYVRLERLDMSELQLKIRRPSVEFCRNKPDSDQNQKNIKQTAMSDGRGTVEKDRGHDGSYSLGRAAKTKFKRIKSNSENKTMMREQVGVIGSKHETQVKKDSECSSKEKIGRKCEKSFDQEAKLKAKHISVSPEYNRTIFEIISSAKYEENNNQKELASSNAKPVETDNGVEKNTKLDFVRNELESNKKLLVASLKTAVLKHKMQMEEMSKRHREENKKKLNRTNAKLPEQGSKTIKNDVKTNQESQKDVLLQSKRKVKDSKSENEKLHVLDKSVDDSGNSAITKKKLKTVNDVSDCCVSDIKLPETNSKTNCSVDLIPATDIEAFQSKALSLISEFDFNGSEDNLGISYDAISDEDKATWAGAAMAIGMSGQDSHSQACGLKAAEIPHMKEEVLMSAMQSVRRKLKMLGLRIEDVPKYLNVDDAWKIACEHPSSTLEVEVCDGIVKFALLNSPQS